MADLANAQHRVVARRQLLRLGLSAKQIDKLVASGQLAVVHRGVYAVGHRKLTREGEWTAAVLVGGRDAVLSHECAGINWQVLSPFPSLPTITTPTSGCRRPGVVFHTAVLPADEVTVHDDIPTTTVARTLFDLAAVLDAYRLEQAIAEAELRRRADSPSMPQLIARYPGHRGWRSSARCWAPGRSAAAPPRARSRTASSSS